MCIITGGQILPYPNEHAARLRKPGDFSKSPTWADGGGGQFRRTAGGTIYGSKKVPSSVGIIWGKLPGADGQGDPPVPQALRFSLDKWTVEKARGWLDDQEIEVILFEEATGEKDETEMGALPDLVIMSHDETFLAERPDGQRPRSYWKELVRVGNWIHPVTGQKVDIEEEHLSYWLSQFREMIDSGLKVPINEDHSPRAKDSHGFCVDVRIREVQGEDGSPVPALFGLMELEDEWADKVDQGGIQDVSAGIKDRKDGHGKTWKSILDHIALTVYPVLEGQSGFIRLSGYVYHGTDADVPGKGDGMKFGKKKEDGAIPPDGQTTPVEPTNDDQGAQAGDLEVRLSALEAEKEALELANQEKDQAIKERDEKLKQLESDEVQRSKDLLLSSLDSKSIIPAKKDELKESVEALWETGLTVEQGEGLRSLVSSLVDGANLSTLPAGKVSDPSDGEDTPFKDRPIVESE